eukprot:TRINITY_DN43286_c0_g1_i1.p1 TRINITY_DN43286_c0_g1~~TRINITY_DN43286_c0_g1_i1.p1  ORF type:complete len:127 (-),score=12.34 TRINITY_DN43286_c0_g1_i1:71-451(-)
MIIVKIHYILSLFVFFFQAEDGIRDLVRSRGLGDVYKRQEYGTMSTPQTQTQNQPDELIAHFHLLTCQIGQSEMNSGEVAFFESTCNFVGADIAGNTTALLTFEYMSITRVPVSYTHLTLPTKRIV